MTDYDSTYLWMFWFCSMVAVFAILSIFQLVGIIIGLDGLTQGLETARRTSVE